MRRAGGFTLIELLIVIVVILILLGISLPNFLKARTRALVARASQEVRTQCDALESYFIDWKVYPPDHHGNWPIESSDESGFTFLTSPIRYVPLLFRDPFGSQFTSFGPLADLSSAYYGGSGSDNAACGGRDHYGNPSLRKNARDCNHAYIVSSVGPDRKRGISGRWAFPSGDPLFQYPVRILTYSPSNGVDSVGDIYRMIGSWKSGYVRTDSYLITSSAGPPPN